MAVKIFRGDAVATAKVMAFTVTAYDAGTTYGITINGKTVSVLGTGGTVNTAAAALQAVLAASSVPEFKEVTWTVSNAVVSGTSQLAGRPFTATHSVSGGSGAMSTSTTTANSGPNDISVASNWSGATLPVGGDTVEFPGTASGGSAKGVDALWGLDIFDGVDIRVVNAPASYSGKIGLPDHNGSYREYRPTRLKVGGAGGVTVNIGQGSGDGSGRIRIDTGANAATWNVEKTAQPADGTGFPAVDLIGTNATANVLRGNVAVAPWPGEVSNIALNVGYISNVEGDATVTTGPGVVLGAVVVNGGRVTLQSGYTSLVMTAGEVQYLSGTSQGSTKVEGGKFYDMAGGSCSPIWVYPGALFDLSREVLPKTINTTITIYKGGSYNDPGYRAVNVAFTVPDGTLKDVNVVQGQGRTYTVS